MSLSHHKLLQPSYTSWKAFPNPSSCISCFYLPPTSSLFYITNSPKMSLVRQRRFLWGVREEKKWNLQSQDPDSGPCPPTTVSAPPHVKLALTPPSAPCTALQWTYIPELLEGHSITSMNTHLYEASEEDKCQGLARAVNKFPRGSSAPPAVSLNSNSSVLAKWANWTLWDCCTI